MKIVKNGRLVDYALPISVDSIPNATEKQKGVMTSEQVKKLEKVSKTGGNAPAWR